MLQDNKDDSFNISALSLSKKPIIRHIVTMGDSLSDRGTLAKRKLFGLIPMGELIGLSTKSPKGRFTNGFTWDDHFAATLSADFVIEHQEKKHFLDSTDVSDAVIDGGLNSIIHAEDKLDSDTRVYYKGREFVRNYNEGGLTAHDYSDHLTLDLPTLFKREILATLSSKRQELFDDDEALKTTLARKLETLVVEWSGANDLITVNSEITDKEADDAVKARIDNVSALYAAGYRNIILFNLPDLSLTPRYQTEKQSEAGTAHAASVYFNIELRHACNKLKKIHPDLFLDIFDVCTPMKDIYNHPEANEFDPLKRTLAYTDSDEFKEYDGISPAPGFMFWDDVHPSATVHAMLAEKFNEKYQPVFQFAPPRPKVLKRSSSAPALNRLGMFSNTSNETLDEKIPEPTATLQFK